LPGSGSGAAALEKRRTFFHRLNSSSHFIKEIVMRKFGMLLVWALIAVVLPSAAFAESGGAVNFGPGIGAGLAMGLAGLGCGIGQGLTAGNTTAGIARNPGAAGAMFTNFILAMVLIESIAIYGFVIAFMLMP
jgi:F-type H+-transporting ATPase subunit c